MVRYKKNVRDQACSETRRSLLEAAAEEFAGRGYAGANINRISETAGFAKGTIYNYFPSKRALMSALIDQIAGTHFRFLNEAIVKESSPRRRVERFFEAGFEFIGLHPGQAGVLITTLYGPDDEFKRRIQQAYLPMFELVGREVIAPGIARRDFQEAVPGSTAGLLMILYLGSCASMDDCGKAELPRMVAAFALKALRRGREASRSGGDRRRP